VYGANMAKRAPDVKKFSYTDDLLDELEASLSRERLGTYLDAAGGDRKGAIELYAWNTAVSAAFYGPLQGLEVTLRNAIHRRLADVAQPDRPLRAGVRPRSGPGSWAHRGGAWLDDAWDPAMG